MIHTRLKWDNVKQHLTYTWWAYVGMAVIMVFIWNMSYQATEYVPPAEKRLQITFAGDFVPMDITSVYEQEIMTQFPELEKVVVDNIPTGSMNEGETDYSGYTKLQMLISVGEGDIYLFNDELVKMYGDYGVLAPLDDLVAEGGELYGVFTEEEIAKGTFIAADTDGQPHLYALPADRLYGMMSLGVNTKDMYMTVMAYAGNPEYARKAVVWLSQETKLDPPEWLEQSQTDGEESAGNVDELPEIG